jgi:DNA-binding IscR family transcriptional regulator
MFIAEIPSRYPAISKKGILPSRCAAPRLIETFTGKHGGAWLRKKPAEISLADIYDAVESPSVILVKERKALKQCHVSCNMQSIMSRVAESTEQAVRKHVAAITLAQLVR